MSVNLLTLYHSDTVYQETVLSHIQTVWSKQTHTMTASGIASIEQLPPQTHKNGEEPLMEFLCAIFSWVRG